MFNIFSSFFGRSNTEVNSVEETEACIAVDEGFGAAESEEEFFEIDEGFEEISEEELAAALNSSPESELQNKTISYILEPLLYTTKYGAKTLSATTMVASYALDGTSYIVAGASYIPHEASKMLGEYKGEDKNTIGYKVITSSQNLLDFTSGAIYTVSYVPYGAGIVLNGVSDVASRIDSSLSSEKIEQICTRSDLLVENVSSKLKEVKGVVVEAMLNASNTLLAKSEGQITESGNRLCDVVLASKQAHFDLLIKNLIRSMVNTKKEFNELPINDKLAEQANNKLNERNEVLKNLNENYKREFGTYSVELTEFLFGELSKPRKSSESDISELHSPSTKMSMLGSISRFFSAPLSCFISGS